MLKSADRVFSSEQRFSYLTIWLSIFPWSYANTWLRSRKNRQICFCHFLTRPFHESLKVTARYFNSYVIQLTIGENASKREFLGFWDAPTERWPLVGEKRTDVLSNVHVSRSCSLGKRCLRRCYVWFKVRLWDLTKSLFFARRFRAEKRANCHHVSEAKWAHRVESERCCWSTCTITCRISPVITSLPSCPSDICFITWSRLSRWELISDFPNANQSIELTSFRTICQFSSFWPCRRVGGKSNYVSWHRNVNFCLMKFHVFMFGTLVW